ncbi:MAG: Na(+)/H(+) antiporter subunit D, partial [Methanotrichaceae archaeon]|nr:Na(+)/H(+) antiporter subunit D [Methanotrichaceae archaeon]
RKLVLDTDWFLRVGGAWILWFIHEPLMSFGAWIDGSLKKIVADFAIFGKEKEERVLIGISAMVGLLFLAAYLIVELIYGYIH